MEQIARWAFTSTEAAGASEGTEGQRRGQRTGSTIIRLVACHQPYDGGARERQGQRRARRGSGGHKRSCLVVGRKAVGHRTTARMEGERREWRGQRTSSPFISLEACRKPDKRGARERQGHRRARRGSGRDSGRAPLSLAWRLAESLMKGERGSGRGSGAHGGAAEGTADGLHHYKASGKPPAL